MTRKEKKDAILAYCYSIGGCDKCKLYPFVGQKECYSEGADIDRNYRILFGESRESASAIDHPSHYSGAKYECIEVMRDVFGEETTKNFCLLNAFKYLWRCGKKHESPDEDINKAIWYLNKYLATKEENA